MLAALREAHALLAPDSALPEPVRQPRRGAPWGAAAGHCWPPPTVYCAGHDAAANSVRLSLTTPPRQAMAEDLNEGFTMWPARQVRGASPLPSSSPSSSSSSSLPSACLTAAGRRSLAG
jgi:hypothetical protein